MIKKSISRRDFIKKTANYSLAGVFLSPAASIKSLTSGGNPSAVAEVNKRLGTIDLKTFASPGTEYRGVPLWFFNDELDVSEVLRQLRSMRYAGWGRVLLRMYRGLLGSPYDEKWNEVTHEVLKACEALDMKVFLQEGNVPFPGMKEEYGQKMLVRRPLNEPAHRNEILMKRIGKYAYYRHVAFDPVRTTAFRRIDTLDPAAMSAYLEELFGFLYDKFGYAFGKTVDAIWVDEPRARNAEGLPSDSLPWTTKLPSIFEKEWGYSLLDALPSLFEDVGDFQKIRHQYWRTICHLFTQGYWKEMGEFCERYNVKFSGHQYGEDTFGRQMEFTINCMPHYEYMQRPGIDHLTGTLTWPRWDPNGYPFILTPKQVSSVAHQLGKKEVLCEMYGVSDQGTSFKDRKWIFDWLAVLGINYRCYHGAFYSLRGLRKRVYPMTLNYQQPWWNDNRIIADYAARLSYVLRQGRYRAEILVIHPIESYYLAPEEGLKDPNATGPLNMDFQTISNNLLKIQRSYDFGDESLLAKYGKVNTNTLSLGEIVYRTVIIPSAKTLRKSTVDILTEFLDNGGNVISVGTLPTLIDGEINSHITKFNQKITRIANEPQTLNLVLNKITPPEIQVIPVNNTSAETIWIHERELDKGRMFFLTNISQELAIDTEVRIKGNGKLEYWNLENGGVESIPQRKSRDYIITKLQFAPTASHLLVLNEEAGTIHIPEKIKSTAWQVPISSYKVKRHDPNALTLDFCRYRGENDRWSDFVPVVGVQDILTDERYSGNVSLQYEFDSESELNNCAVVIEDAKDYTVLINGSRINYEGLPHYRDRSFHPIDISYLVRKGTNTIEISRYFQAVSATGYSEKTFGTELEQIYLIGDFAVKGKRIGQDRFESITRHRYSTDFTVINEKGTSNGDLLADGYCFFNGTISLIATAILPKAAENERVYIDIDQLNSTLAEIKVNNLSTGTLAWPPYRLDITDYVWEGENKIEISLTNSLRNLLGALHYIPALPGAWAFKFSGRRYGGPDWVEKRNQGLKYWSDDYFFRPLGVNGNVSVICERHK